MNPTPPPHPPTPAPSSLNPHAQYAGSHQKEETKEDDKTKPTVLVLLSRRSTYVDGKKKKEKKKVGWDEEGAEEVINWTVATSPTPTPIPTLPAQYIGYVRTKRVSSIFSWCFEPHSVTSGLTDEERKFLRLFLQEEAQL